MKHNRADIKRQSYEDHPMQNQAKVNLKIAGSNLAPWGMSYEGTAAVHLYKKPGSLDYVFISHLSDMGSIPEGQADVALKELRRALMAQYGREDVRRTDTKEEML